MAVIHQFIWHTLSGDTEINLQGQDGVRIHPDSASSPRLIGIQGGVDGMEIAIHNLSGTPIPIVHDSGSASAANRKIRTTGLGGDFTLPDGQEVWAILVDPNDTVLADAKRGWYLDSGGQEALARDSTTASTSDPTQASATPAVIPEMTLTVTTVGGDVVLAFDMGLELQDGDAGTIQLYVDGVAVASTLRDMVFNVVAGNVDGSPSIGALVEDLAAGSHTFDVRWAATAGSMRCNGLQRSLRVFEMA